MATLSEIEHLLKPRDHEIALALNAHPAAILELHSDIVSLVLGATSFRGNLAVDAGPAKELERWAFGRILPRYPLFIWFRRAYADARRQPEPVTQGDASWHEQMFWAAFYAAHLNRSLANHEIWQKALLDKTKAVPCLDLAGLLDLEKAYSKQVDPERFQAFLGKAHQQLKL